MGRRNIAAKIPQSYLKAFSPRVVLSPTQPISFGGLMLVIATGLIPRLPLNIFSTMVYVAKQPVAWKEYCAEYLLKGVFKHPFNHDFISIGTLAAKIKMKSW